MVNEELLLECCKKKVTELNKRIVDLECINYAWKKENEQLERRISLLENRPVPRHYDSRLEGDCDGLTFGNRFFNRLDMYTLEKIYVELGLMIEREQNRPVNNISQLCGFAEVRSWLWSLMDSDSREWLTKSEKEYYDE